MSGNLCHFDYWNPSLISKDDEYKPKKELYILLMKRATSTKLIHPSNLPKKDNLLILRNISILPALRILKALCVSFRLK